MHVVRHLAADLPAAVLVTIDLRGGALSSLVECLRQAGSLPIRLATDGEMVQEGHVYVAPPGRHLLVEERHLQLGYGPRENGCRPAVDAMLRAAAVSSGSRAVGVVLTGAFGDGASGLWALGQCGGVTVVQDQSDAAFSSGTRPCAGSWVTPDHVMRLADMPGLLDTLARQPAGTPVRAPASMSYEVRIARGDGTNVREMDRLGSRSILACPNCHGVMWEILEGEIVRYRCHTGHAFSAEAMGRTLDEDALRGIESATRALEERLALVRRLEQRLQRGARPSTKASEESAQEIERKLGALREATRRIDQITAEEEMSRPG